MFLMVLSVLSASRYDARTQGSTAFLLKTRATRDTARGRQNYPSHSDEISNASERFERASESRTLADLLFTAR